MDERLKKQLLKGEKVLWTGKAKPFNLMEAPYKNKLIARIVICVVIAIILPILYFKYAFDSSGAVAVALAIIPLLIILRPITEKNTIEKKVNYAITNLRAIVYTSASKSRSILLDEVDKVCVEELSNGAGVVYVGEACNLPSNKSRDMVLYGSINEEQQLVGLAFYSVENPKMIAEYFPVPYSIKE